MLPALLHKVKQDRHRSLWRACVADQWPGEWYGFHNRKPLVACKTLSTRDWPTAMNSGANASYAVASTAPLATDGVQGQVSLDFAFVSHSSKWVVRRGGRWPERRPTSHRATATASQRLTCAKRYPHVTHVRRMQDGKFTARVRRAHAHPCRRHPRRRRRRHRRRQKHRLSCQRRVKANRRPKAATMVTIISNLARP